MGGLAGPAHVGEHGLPEVPAQQRLGWIARVGAGRYCDAGSIHCTGVRAKENNLQLLMKISLFRRSGKGSRVETDGWVDRDIIGVKQGLHVAPKQQSVLYRIHSPAGRGGRVDTTFEAVADPLLAVCQRKYVSRFQSDKVG